MSKIILSPILKIFIMSAILANIKTLPINDRSREMANFVGYNQKLARTLGQISFLVDCRALKIMPTFITNKTAQITKTHQNHRVTSRVDALTKTMLNEEIKDAFRKKAFLQRSMSRSAELIGESTAEWRWLHGQCKKLFIDELATVRERLCKKLTELRKKAGHLNLDLTRSKIHQLGHVFTPAPDVAVRTNLHTASPAVTADSASPSPALPVSSAAVAADDPLRQQRSQTSNADTDDTQCQRNELPRLANLSNKHLNDNITPLLEKGPNYALTNRVSPALLQSVEVGLERAFYGLKWKTAIEARKSARTDANPPPTPATPIQDDDEEDDGASEMASMPRPYFSDTIASQPPVVEAELERNLQKIKEKVIGVYKGAKKTPQNWTTTQQQALEAMKKDEDIIIKRSDKCKSLVVMNTVDYVAKAESIVNSYENVAKNPTTKLEDETKNLIKSTLKDKIPDDYIQRLLPQHTRTAEFYGLPKTHKTGNPLRPIVSACGDPLDKLSWFVQCILAQILSLIPAHLPNTESFLTKLGTAFPQGLPQGAIVFSLDVCNLYGSIPIREGIDAVISLIESNMSKVNMFGITIPDLRNLLSHILTNNYVRFGSKIFKQTSGIAMGNRIAPPVAITFMHVLETGFMSTLEFAPSLYLRYIDDIIGVWTHGIDRLNHFYNCINTYNPSITFTMQSTFHTGQLPFLDTLITVHPMTGKYTTELYFKPMAAPIIIHYTSAHPMSTKKGVLNSEVKRAIKVSSDEHARNRSLDRVKMLFEQNGYPKGLVDKAIKNSIYKRNNKKFHQSKKAEVYMRLPYVDENVVKRVNGILRKSKTNIKVAWTSGPTLRQKLVRSAFSRPSCPAGARHCHTCDNGLKGRCTYKNVVYKITCQICERDGRT